MTNHNKAAVCMSWSVSQSQRHALCLFGASCQRRL